MRESEPPPKALITAIGVLLLLQVICVVTAAVCCHEYVGYTRELRTLQAQTTFINNNRMQIQALANDTLEYSKKNPSIDPILESVGLKAAKSAAPTGAKPTTK